MALSGRPKWPLALIVASFFLLAPLAPMVGAAPGDDGPLPPGEDRGPGDGGFIADEGDEVIPIVTILDGPEDDLFANFVTNLGDVDGDGVDDLVIGNGYNYWREKEPGQIGPSGSKQYYLPGREDRDYSVTDLTVVGNGSSGWAMHAERWLGDVNGDGHADLVYKIDPYGGILDGDSGEEYIVEGAQYQLFVHYGSEDGFGDHPDLTIDLRDGMTDPNTSYFSFQYGGVGDVDGDGYNDLFVLRHGYEIWEERPGNGGDPGGGGGSGDDPDEPPDNDRPDPWPEPNVTYYPPDYQLFLGSQDGLPSEPSWNGTPELETRWWWLQGIHSADVNGDGYSDIILASSMAPHIMVFHGSRDGMSTEPDMTVTFNNQFSYGWTLHAPVDFNGDAYDDIVIDYGQAEGLFDYVQYVYFFPGSDLGIPTKPTDQYKLVLEDLSSDNSPRITMVDINGDGLDDVLVHAVLPLRTAESDELWLQLHFNTGDGIAENPSWNYRYTTDFDVPQLSMSDQGDLDGDGYGDVAISAPGEWVWWDDGTQQAVRGHLIIINGGGIMDLMRSLTLREGPDLYAGYKSYDFRVNVNPTGLVTLPGRVRLVLDPGGADVILEAGLLHGGSYFAKEQDPEDLVTLTSDLTDIVHDADNNTIWVHFRVMFNWSWPHEDLCDANVLTFIEDVSTPYMNDDVFWVENDLEFIGDLLASGALQGDLEEDDWVMAGEDVTVSGPTLVYQGTLDVYPPSGVCTVALTDRGGGTSTSAHVAGATVSLTLGMDEGTDLEETLTLTLQDLPGLATLVSELEFPIRVDGDVPTFTNPVPGPDDWHSSSQVLTSITADDGQTSGVLSSSLEYATSIDGGTTWTEWSTSNLEVTGNGPTVDGMVLLTLPDGEDNLLRWRAKDLVGNGPAVSADMRIKVDTINVTYTSAFPDPDDWHTVLGVECGVTIRDEDGAGILVASIQYRVSHSNLSGYGEWQSWETSVSDGQQISVSQLITMGDTAYNYVQWRAKDIAGNGYTTSPHFKVRVDTSPIEFYALFPEVGPHGQSTLLCGANVTDGDRGSGIALASIDYRVFTGGEWSEWTNLEMSGSSQHNRISVEATFQDGENNRIQFRGSDVAGNGPTTSEEHFMTVDTTGPEFGDVTPGPDDKQPGPDVTVTITVSDAISGIDTDSIAVRYGTEGHGSLGEWQDVYYGNPLTGTVWMNFTFVPGVENVVEFKAADMLGNEATSTVATIWVNRAPLAFIKSPTSSEVYRENDPVTLNGTLSSDPDEDQLNYTWYHDLQVDPIGYGKVLDVDLPVGIYNVTLVVTDDVGASDESSVQVTVEEYIPPSTETSSVLWWVLLVVVLAAVMGASFIIWKRKGSEDEWEEV